MSSVSSSISKSNNNFISFLEIPVVKYSILILITVFILFIEKIDTKYLDIFDIDIFKIIYAFFIAYTACFDPIYAIILTTFLIMAIQELHNRRSMASLNSNKLQKSSNNQTKPTPPLSLSKINKNSNQSSPSVVYETMPKNEILNNDKIIYDFINKHTLQKTPDSNDSLYGEYDYYEDPAFKTITNNLEEKNKINKNQFYVTDDDLVNAQTNTEQGVNQNTSMQAFTSNILNIQGLPNGYDPKSNYNGFM
jgi:hypothetical protein